MPQTECQWKQKLTPEEYTILREKGTERPFTGEYDKFIEPGPYRCAGCDHEFVVSDVNYTAGWDRAATEATGARGERPGRRALVPGRRAAAVPCSATWASSARRARPPIVPPGDDDVPAVVLDPSATVSAFGWHAKVGFQDTIRRMLTWYDTHGVSAIYSHLAKAIQSGDIKLQDVTGLDEKTITLLRNAIEQYEEEGRLKPVFDALNGEYDYNILRCVKAAMLCEVE